MLGDRLFDPDNRPPHQRSATEHLSAVPPERAFDGHTYVPELDYARLGNQAKLVFDLMADGTWRTLREIADQTRAPEASVSARLRDFRKARFGGLTVRRRRRGEAAAGIFEYRLDVGEEGYES